MRCHHIRVLALVGVVALSCPALGQDPTSEAAAKNVPPSSPLTLSIGSVRTVAEQAAVRLLIDLTKDLTGIDYQTNARNGLLVVTPDIKILTGSADAFEGIVVKATGNLLFFRTAVVDGVETPDTRFFHAIAISLGAESDGRFEQVNGVAEIGYVPWFQGAAPRVLKGLHVGAFLQGGYKNDMGGRDTVTTGGGKLDESKEAAGDGLFRAKASGRWNVVTRSTASGLALGLRASADFWRDLRNAANYNRVVGTLRLHVSAENYFDFVFERGSGAPNFHKGDQFSANLTFAF